MAADHQQTISKEDIQDIQNKHWEIDTIEAHQTHIPIGPQVGFLCSWKDTAWDVTDPNVNTFMQSKVSLHNIRHIHVNSCITYN